MVDLHKGQGELQCMGYIGTCMCHCEGEGILSRLVWDGVMKSESFDMYR